MAVSKRVKVCGGRKEGRKGNEVANERKRQMKSRDRPEGLGSAYRCQPVKELGLPAGARLQAEWRPSMPGLHVCMAQVPGVHPTSPVPSSWFWCVYRVFMSC